MHKHFTLFNIFPSRLIWPGRLDSEIFFNTHLRRILTVDGEIKPSMAELDAAFSKHVQDRSTSAAQGKPPATANEVIAAATDRSVRAIAQATANHGEMLNNILR